MDGMLSQEEINALLNEPGVSDIGEQPLTDAEKDAIGEVANISMGTAATALFSLVNKKVDISTPVVSFATWEDIVAAYERPCVFIRIGYMVGLDGSNVLVLKEHDVKVITDLMMGGDGTNTQEELGEMHLSAICEAMNQMMGSAATSLSSMLNKMIDISPPEADVVDLAEAFPLTVFLRDSLSGLHFGWKSAIWLTVRLCSYIRFLLQRKCIRIYQKIWKLRQIPLRINRSPLRPEHRASPSRLRQPLLR